jgi:ribosome production factor 1
MRHYEARGETPWEAESDAERTPSIPSVSHIKNKAKRLAELARVRHDALVTRQAKRKAERLAESQSGVAKRRRIPKTIENTRVADETIVRRDDAETLHDAATDELAPHFAGVREPRILLTTNEKPTKHVLRFVWRELRPIFPTARAFKRQNFALRDILRFAERRNYTDVIVVNEDRKKPNGILFIHLPDGPTAYFKLTSIRTREMLGVDRAARSGVRPELILNNFGTRLGHSVGRLFASLFPHNPEFRSRRVITLHNQRDFIFFRQHRYIFEENPDVNKPPAPGRDKPQPIICRLQEVGPRFTLKLQTLQNGVFDGSRGDFEYVRQREESRRKFTL